MPVAIRTRRDLAEWLMKEPERKVFPNQGTVHGVAPGEIYTVLNDLQAFWYPEGNIAGPFRITTGDAFPVRR